MIDELVFDLARDYKASLVEDREPQPDITPIAVFERRGEYIAAIAPIIDRDTGLRMLQIGAAMFAPDAVTFVTDCHYSNETINPTTGKPWGPNEMQNLCDHGDGCLVGVTHDCLAYVRMTRLGAEDYVVHPYHVDKGKAQVHWLPTKYDEYSSISGLVPDSIRASLDEPPAATWGELKTIADELGIPKANRQGHIDNSARTVLQRMGCSVEKIRRR